MMRSSVDLPEPLGPSSAVSDPLSTSSETSSRATKSPNRFETLRTRMDMLAPSPPVGRITVMRDEDEDRRSARARSRWRRRPRGRSSRSAPARAGSRSRSGPAGGPETTATAPYSPRQRAVVEDHAVDHRPADRRQRDAPERLPAARAERPRRLLLLVADLAERRARPRARRTGARRRSSRSPSTAARRAPGCRGPSSQPPNQPVAP